MDPSNSGEDEELSPDIFLSHSYEEMGFVTDLYTALQRANFAILFWKEYCLSGSSSLPYDEETALCRCKLGVVVLSHNYLTSRRSMLELQMLVAADKMLFPIFYTISSEDFKSPQNLLKWQESWQKWNNQQQADQWSKALESLRSINGISFKQEGEDIVCINEVVTKLENIIRPNPLYDQSLIQGCQALTQEIAIHFDELAVKRRDCGKACMLGFHGMRGLGKTTLCKSMVNFYNSRYRGRSCLIEFPGDDDKFPTDDKKIVENCKMALRKLTNCSTSDLKEDNSFEQVIKLMKRHMEEFDVFLAIDNVRPESERAAKSLLDVSFSAASKVLLMSRSKQVLCNLLKDSDNSCIDPLPAPTHENAFQIFQQSLNRGDLTFSPLRNEIDRVLERFRFDGKYNPLALKALGISARNLCVDGMLERGDGFSLFMDKLNDIALQIIVDEIKPRYNALPLDMKYMFLDIAVWILYPVHILLYKRMHADALRWLRFFYEKLSEEEIAIMIDELALAGVIHMEKDDNGEQMIGVHDHYLELAQREAALSPRFLTSTDKAVEQIEWGELERVILKGCKSHHIVENIQFQQCKSVQFLYLSDIKTGRILPVFMPALRVLILVGRTDGRARFDASDSAASGLDGLWATRNIHLNDLVQLKFLWCEGFTFVKRFDGLDALLNVQMLVIRSCPCLKNLSGLRCLTQLKDLDVQNCEALIKVPDLAGVTGLARLTLLDNESLEEVGCLSPALKEVTVGGCRALKKIQNLGGMTGLERLTLDNNESLEEVECFSPALKEVTVRGCGAWKKMPDLGGLPSLQRLTLRDNKLMEEVGSPCPALKEVIVEGCEVLQKMPELSGITGLERLILRDNELLEEVGSWSVALKEVTVEWCGALKIMPDLGVMTGLKRLMLGDNNSLEKVQCNRSAPQEITITNCGALKVMCLRDCTLLTELPCIRGSGLETLRFLYLICLEQLPQLPGSICSMKALALLDLTGCVSLQELPHNIGDLASLKILVLKMCRSLLWLPDSVCALKALALLDLTGCERLEKLPHNIGDLASLKLLVLKACASLHRLPDSLCALKALISLDLAGCEMLMELPHNIGDLASLRSLVLNMCKSLRWLPNSVRALKALISLDLTGCERLLDFPYIPLDLPHIPDNQSADIIGDLASLKLLVLQTCTTLVYLPNSVCALKALISLDLTGCVRLAVLSPNIGDLASLRSLVLKMCGSLRRLPDSVCALKALISLDLTGCKVLQVLPRNIGDLASLRSLVLKMCGSLLELPDSVCALKALISLDLTGCQMLMCLPKKIGDLVSLRSLVLNMCKKKLHLLPDSVCALKALILLDLTGCQKLQVLPRKIGDLASLRSLVLKMCGSLWQLPDSVCALKALISLDLTGCERLQVLPDNIGDLVSLRSLVLNMCTSLLRLPDSLCAIKGPLEVRLKGCVSLLELPHNIGDMPLLQLIDLPECHHLVAPSTQKREREQEIESPGDVTERVIGELEREVRELERETTEMREPSELMENIQQGMEKALREVVEREMGELERETTEMREFEMEPLALLETTQQRMEKALRDVLEREMGELDREMRELEKEPPKLMRKSRERTEEKTKFRFPFLKKLMKKSRERTEEKNKRLFSLSKETLTKTKKEESGIGR